jgi:hypothetical protein
MDTVVESSASRDDSGLAEFTAALTSPDPGAFRSTALWSAPVAQFEAKQKAPLFVRDSWARWHRQNRAEARYEAIAEADKRRRFGRAAIVRPIRDGCVGTRKLPTSGGAPSAPLLGPNNTTCAQPSPTPPTRTPTIDTLQHPDTSPAHSSISPQRDLPTPRRATARLLDPIPITPKTYRRIAKLPAPDTFMEGVALIANILDSHYRLKSLQDDEGRHRRSVAYVTGRRLDALKAECQSGRNENLSSFLRLMQRVQTSERGPLDVVQVAQWFDGFVGCAMLSTPVDGAAQAESASVEGAYLGLSATNVVDADHPITWTDYLVSPLREADSAAARALQNAERSEVLLPISALRTACTMRSIPLITKSTWDGHSTESTFLECLHRQLPNARHHVDNAVVQLMQAGVMPHPRWLVDLHHTFTVGSPIDTLPSSKKWLLTSNVVHGALGMLHVKEDTQRRRSSVSTRGMRTPPSSLGKRPSMPSHPHGDEADSPSMASLRPASPQTSLQHKPIDLELTAEGLSRMLRSVNKTDGGGDSLSPSASAGESFLLSVEVADTGAPDGSNTEEPGAGGVPIQATTVSPAAAALVRRFDVDGSGGLSRSEFLACAWADKSLRVQGRW